MNWRFKLSMRLALLRGISASAVVLAACTADAGITDTGASEFAGEQSAAWWYQNPVATITLTPAQQTIAAGESQQLTAVLKDSRGRTLTGRTIAWTSSAPAVATVSATGLVAGLSGGTTTITASSGGKAATASITVTAPIPPDPVPVSITITPATSSIVAGTSVQLSAVVKDAQGVQLTGKVITWSTSAAALVTISTSGLATGLAAGTAVITAACAGLTSAAQILVTPVPGNPVVTLAAASAPAGGSPVLVTLSGAPLSATVGFGFSGGTSGITLSAATNAGNGVYTANITPVTAGTATTIKAWINGQQVAGTMPTFTVTGSVAPPPPPPPPPPPGGFVTPNILNNADFESTFSGFTNWGYATPTGVTRDTAHAMAGRYGVRKTLPVTAGTDIGSQLIYPFVHIGSAAAQDRIWLRYYFFLDRAIDGGFKFVRFFDSALNIQFSGLGVQAGSINARFDPEAGAGGTPLQINIASLAGLTSGWHSIEIDYWRNGDTSNGGNDYPSMAFWIDGVQITRQSSGSLVSPSAWVGGRYNAGKRTSTAKIGVVELLGLLNGTPANSIAGNIWVDRVSISTAGRIGP